MANRFLRYLLGLSSAALLAGSISAFGAPAADLTPPKITAPPDITIEASGPLTQVKLGDASAQDDVGVVSLTNDAPGDFPVGVTVVRWTAEDEAGNRAHAVQKVTVVDSVPPVIMGLKDLIVEADSDQGAAAFYDVTAADDVDETPVLKVSRPSGSVFPLGVTTVTCTATDRSGNVASGSFKVTVADTTPPAINLSSEVHVFVNTPVTAASVHDYLTGATAEDTVDKAIPVKYELKSALDTPGPKTVVFTATDKSGNTATATGTIWVGYRFGGFVPGRNKGSFELGRDVPVKFQLTDANGNPVPSAVAKLWLMSGVVVIDAGAGPDCCGHFTYDPKGRQYICNLSTQGLWPGEWQVQVELDDKQVKTYTLNLAN